ncbi:hypothetical protein [Propionicimonas sp.]|uniref:hypothetical protein n=1 Tax=Propionicimonas sp. TaxID=1955623 RepID=UPI0017BB1610|nr:hypothetical protein [Propionicimonas sp.]MBU3977105.1 hypothetical protein [Actinomycetota bacterium]MBA3020674.1 hypothetical protein [Propionicimonas sp.]MBU3985045.1 hypothetical protein [Actinomycetota bacterium]MBU4006998.1 hypothetical protein [Actinomycetota bacterium]MBU4064751.1 hypothetical protein [Actinomycetota bacterium]
MIENLKRVRELLSWVAIGLTVLGMGLTVWRLVTALNEMSVFQAFQEVGSGWLNFSIALLLVVLVLSCSLVAPATPRALLLAKLAAVVLSLGVLLTLVSVLMGMWASAAGIGVVLDVLGGLLDVGFKAITAGAIWVFLRGVKAGRIGTASPTAARPSPTPAAPQSEQSSVEPVEPVATTWSRDRAAGAVWWTAADAAAGAPARDKMPESEEPTTLA